MQNLVIIGGGFAGFWSAMSAARQARELGKSGELKIILISKDEYHAIRPRFYESDLASMRVPIKNYLAPLGIDLIVGEVSGVDTQNRRISITNRADEIRYDALILAAGSRLRTKGIPGIELAFNVDTFVDASKLDQHLNKLADARFATLASRSFVVVGGGFTGLEAITSLPQRVRALAPEVTGFRFFLVERAREIAPNYSPDGRRYIVEQLGKAEIQILPGEEVTSIAAGKIVLKSGKSLETDTVIWTTGLEASPLTASFDGERDELGRLCVDSHLRLPACSNVFIAGDVARVLADQHNHALMSCQHAMPQGKFAGHNAVNQMFGEQLLAYSQPRYNTCLDLGPENALLTTGWERNVKMSGVDAKSLKNQIVTQWIYPKEDVESNLKMSTPEVLMQ
ncbi:MAG: FAD-dependent oxidoreductase [Betaproteobacteria bacterium]|nr:FAD-dependent oxidoreductase [Betaproteobacteria bacterium]